jgi:hypothetical protein
MPLRLTLIDRCVRPIVDLDHQRPLARISPLLRGGAHRVHLDADPSLRSVGGREHLEFTG